VNWEKLGLVFCPRDNHAWMVSHASYPFAESLDDGNIKVYFSTRDKDNRSSIGFAVFNVDSPGILLDLSESPVLSPGEIGTFDYNGVSMASLCIETGRRLLYYLGWNLLSDIPWRNTIGLAVYNETTRAFERYSRAPVLGINRHDPFTLTYPYVLKDGGQYTMWYGSSLYWGPRHSDTIHVIKAARSRDGLNWETNGKTCIGPEEKTPCAFTRPCVVKDNGLYKMWYSYCYFSGQKGYLLGYAESTDGITWEKMDEQAGLLPSKTGWDSEMTCYPHVFDHGNTRYMLYNGNGFGKSGFGLARLVG